MTLSIPPILAEMIAAHNAHDADAFLDCFADDAIVRDEGKMHVGRPAIRAWFEEVCRKYRPRFEVTDLSFVDGEPVLTGSVSGEFDGSPIQLRYLSGLEDGKIVALKIVS
jgi:uncharacterized protein (TIGR02246 family)